MLSFYPENTEAYKAKKGIAAVHHYLGLLQYNSLDHDTGRPGGLHARLCHTLMRILSSSANGTFTNNQSRQKCIVFAFVILQQIKKMIANGYEKLNKRA